MEEHDHERHAGPLDRQAADDRRVVDELGLDTLVYGWRGRRPVEPLPFQMGHHVWELYRLPEEADDVARATLARTTDRSSHWLLDWPGRDQVLLRRPPDLGAPGRSGWPGQRRRRDLEQRLADSCATVTRLDAVLERVEVLEPLYVERAEIHDHDWQRTVALLPDGRHIALCPWDWYEFIVGDFVDSCAAAVRRERED